MLYAAITAALLTALVALVAWGRVPRHWVSLAALLLLLATGAVAPSELPGFIDWDVLGLILGMSVFTVFLEESGVVELASRAIASRSPSPRTLVFILALLSGLISVFLENVTVVLLLAPLALRLSRRLGVDPVELLIPIALASNMAGSATMVGDPPAIMVAGFLGLGFADFIWYDGRPSMFFLTLAPMALACGVAALMVRSAGAQPQGPRGDVAGDGVRRVDRVFAAEAILFLGVKIALLSLRRMLGIPLSLAVAAGLGGLTAARLLHGDTPSVARAYREGFEWRTLLFLIGVFALSGAFAKHGLAEATARWVVEAGRGSLFAVTTLLVWLSVAASAFIDNVPYTATMLPVVAAVSRELGVDPVVIAWAVLLGTTLGGNLTYIGASANVVAVRILERHGARVSFARFMRISVPFNTASVVAGWVLYELLYVLL